MDTAYTENKGIVVLGDFNIDILPSSNHPLEKSWSDIAHNYELSQIITKPTRVTSTTKTLLDHIYINTNIITKYSDVLKWSISDHFPVYLVIGNYDHEKEKKKKHTVISYREVKKYK